MDLGEVLFACPRRRGLLMASATIAVRRHPGYIHCIRAYGPAPLNDPFRGPWAAHVAELGSGKACLSVISSPNIPREPRDLADGAAWEGLSGP